MSYTIVADDGHSILLAQLEAEYGPFDFQLVESEVYGLAALYFPMQEVQNATRVAHLESGFHTGAWARKGEDSRGLWQINVVPLAHPTLREHNLFDARVNAYYAAQIYRAAGNWSPWLNSAIAIGLPH